ncbi:riboflavin-binding protein-like [Sycon ciliatum]|uniref:riboflavin-binding protein-like n=1 Tax=Sycon ciliatum TaxID=27933 RepID=UPI0031F6A4EE
MASAGWSAMLVACLAGMCVVSRASAQARYRTDGLCIQGGRHKARASPEGAGYSECFNYQQNSCCTANFTRILAAATVVSVDNFHWGRCGNLSQACEDFMIHIECFYRCSPNAAHWEGQFPSSIAGVPLCSGFCDDWWSACRQQLSCATNWLFDYNTTDDGENFCRTDSQCLTWEDRYGNASNMCNTLWGASFTYTTDPVDCVELNGTNLVARNSEVARRLLLTGAVSSVQAMPIVVLLGFVAAVVLLLG